MSLLITVVLPIEYFPHILFNTAVAYIIADRGIASGTGGLSSSTTKLGIRKNSVLFEKKNYALP